MGGIQFFFFSKLNNSKTCILNEFSGSGSRGNTGGGGGRLALPQSNLMKENVPPPINMWLHFFVFPYLSIATKKAPIKSDDSENLTFIKMDSRVKRMYKFAVWCEVNWHAPNIPLLTPPAIFQARGGDVQYHIKIHIHFRLRRLTCTSLLVCPPNYLYLCSLIIPTHSFTSLSLFLILIHSPFLPASLYPFSLCIS